jgi:hypothetical protein
MFISSNVTGEIPDIIHNAEGLYEGDLRYYFRVIHKVRNIFAPFHNLRHMLHVFFMCHEALRFYKKAGIPIDKIEARCLLISALVHDANHTGMSDEDGLNIEIALKFLHSIYLGVDILNVPKIEQLVRWTEYPHKTPVRSMSLCGQILVDADRTQALNPAWIQQCVGGLAQEWNVTFIEALRRNIDFHIKLSFETEWARAIFPPALVNSKVLEAERYLAALEH